MDPAVALCIEQEKEKCLEVIEAYYKKNNHPSVVRLQGYLQHYVDELVQREEKDPTLLEDLERIKKYHN
jgi:hypothetical protein